MISVVTALFAVSGVELWVFLVSAVLSLPLFLVTVFLGQALQDEEQGTSVIFFSTIDWVTDEIFHRKEQDFR